MGLCPWETGMGDSRWRIRATQSEGDWHVSIENKSEWQLNILDLRVSRVYSKMPSSSCSVRSLCTQFLLVGLFLTDDYVLRCRFDALVYLILPWGLFSSSEPFSQTGGMFASPTSGLLINQSKVCIEYYRMMIYKVSYFVDLTRTDQPRINTAMSHEIIVVDYSRLQKSEVKFQKQTKIKR